MATHELLLLLLLLRKLFSASYTLASGQQQSVP
jgi:hypothetical protein